MVNAKEFVEMAVEKIRREVKGKAIIAVSGGIDSSVAAEIGRMALGKNLTAVYVDTGLMREGESDEVRKFYEKKDIDFIFFDARKDFIDALRGIVDPEEKRKIIGEKFIRIFEKIAKEKNAEYLIQGTIAPDWIESGEGSRDKIKSHHNVGGLPEKIGVKIVDPLRDLYKNEVREIAKYLGIELQERQPFPGPGLAVRIIGEVNEENLKIVRKACKIVEEEIENFCSEKKISRPWQYFAVLLPVRSVGMRGGRRAYGYTIAIRSVDSSDAMTANYSKLPNEVLEKIANRIFSEIKDVNRVVYDISNKPPATIDWE